MAVLFISYDGMLEPLGQSQVIAYLEKLAPGRVIHLISFEKPEDWKNRVNRQAIAARLAAAGIHWHPLRYHRKWSALATAYDILRGTAAGLYLVLRHRLKIVHARSYVPSVMAVAIKRLSGAKYLFDMRGLWADERVDGGIWSRQNPLYKTAKSLERLFFKSADAVVSLTHAGAREIRSFSYLRDAPLNITVIPTCADLRKFSADGNPDAGAAVVVGYVGSAGTWYLLDEAIACFKLVQKRHPDAMFLVVNRNDHDYIRHLLRQAGVGEKSFQLVAAEHQDMPALIRQMTIGLVLIKPAYSKIASAPTKLAEFLGCGVPCLGNTGVGDMAEILEGENIGVVLQAGDDAARAQAVDKMLRLVADPGTRHRCAEAAQKLFSLEKGAAAYDALYQAMAAPSPNGRAGALHGALP